MSEKIIDYRTSGIGLQNWEVCSRMLVHDLIDLSASIPELAKVLKHYGIGYTENGGYTMSLPRLGALNQLPVKKAKAKLSFAKSKPQISKKNGKYVE